MWKNTSAVDAEAGGVGRWNSVQMNMEPKQLPLAESVLGIGSPFWVPCFLFAPQ